MPACYANAHKVVYAPLHYAAAHILDVKPHELVKALADRTNKSVRQIAVEMGGATFQGTLHKFIHGHTRTPDRVTAQRIAKYFGLSVEALYDERAATQAAREHGVIKGAVAAPLAREEPPRYGLPLVPIATAKRARFSAAVQRRIDALAPEQVTALEAIIVAALDAMGDKSAAQKRRLRAR